METLSHQFESSAKKEHEAPTIEVLNTEYQVEPCSPRDPNYILRYGSKVLELRITTVTEGLDNSTVSHLWADTFLRTDNSEAAVMGETTAIYKSVRELLQKIAEDNNIKVSYYFVSNWPKLVRWALTTGAEIFGWKTTDTFIDPGNDNEMTDQVIGFRVDFLPSERKDA